MSVLPTWLTISGKPDGVGAVLRPWIAKDERSLSPTRIEFKGKLPERMLYSYKLLVDNEAYDATPQ
jgi:hypothetical protein